MDLDMIGEIIVFGFAIIAAAVLLGFTYVVLGVILLRAACGSRRNHPICRACNSRLPVGFDDGDRLPGVPILPRPGRDTPGHRGPTLVDDACVDDSDNSRVPLPVVGDQCDVIAVRGLGKEGP